MTVKGKVNHVIGKGGRVKLPDLVIVNKPKDESEEVCSRKLEDYFFGKKGGLCQWLKEITFKQLMN